ncbi:MAG: hypothetical protein IKV61_01835 [Clostridia bacterium]|nr:hypothetical protein [Clostridia bacterium]
MEGKMFIIGLALGAMGGALLAINSNKVRTMIKNGQDEVMRKAEQMCKEQLDNKQSKSEKKD